MARGRRRVAVCLAFLAAFCLYPRVHAQPIPLSGTMTDQLVDDRNGNTLADPGDTLRYTIILTNPGPTDATGVVLQINLDSNTHFLPGSLTSGILAIDDPYPGLLAHVAFSATAAVGLLANDVSPVTAPLSLVGYSPTSALGGTVQAASDGSFTYLPPPGVMDATDHFIYLIGDGLGHAAMATAELGLVGPLVWFVDNQAPLGGNGTRYAPFDSLTPVDNSGSDADGPGDTIFVYQGNAPYSGGLALESGQTLLGQGVDLIVLGRLLVAATVRPTLTRSGGPCLALAAGGNTVRGLNLDDTTGAGISGSGLSGAYLLEHVAITRNAGDGIVFSNSGASTLTMDDLSVETTAGRGLAITGSALGLVADVAAVRAAGGAALDISGCAMDATFGSVLRSAGAGPGLRLQNNSGMTYIGDLAITNSGNIGLLASNAGNVSVAGATSFVATTGGRALSVSGGTFEGLFETLAASNSDFGIMFSPASGSLTVTGVGTTVDSGGTISSMSQDGILLAHASDITLKNMLVQTSADNGLDMDTVSRVVLDQVAINGTGSHGVRGTGVIDFTLRNGCQVQNAGDAAGEDGLYFAAFGANNLLGTVEIFDSSVSDFHNDGLSVNNISGALVMTVSGSAFSNSASSAEGGSGILLLAGGTHQATLTVQNGCTFGDLRLDGVLARSEGTSSNVVATVQGNTFQNSAAGGGGGGVNLGANGASASVNAKLVAKNNTLSNLDGPGFVLLCDGSAHLEGTVGGAGQGNTITGAADGVLVRVDGNGAGTGSGIVLVKSDVMGSLSGDGVNALARDGAVALDLTVEDGFLGGSGPVLGSGISVLAQDQASVRSLLRLNAMTTHDIGISLSSRDTATLQSIVLGNALAPITAGANGLSATSESAGATLRLNLNAAGALDARNSTAQGYRITRTLGTFLVQGLVGSPPFSDAAVKALIETNNTGTATVSGGDNFGTGVCQTPALPSP